MLKLLRQNQNIILTSVGLFLVSLTALLFLINNGLQSNHKELKADVISYGKTESNLEEVKYRELVKNEDDPLFVLNLDGTIDLTSKDFIAASGYNASKLEGKLFFSLIRPKDQATFLSALSNAYLSEEPVSMVGPFNVTKADGSVSIYMGSVFPVKEGDKVKKIVLTIKDITSKVEESASDQPASDQLESETASETADVQEDTIVTTRPSREIRSYSRGNTASKAHPVQEVENSEQIPEPVHVDQPNHYQPVTNSLTPDRSLNQESNKDSNQADGKTENENSQGEDHSQDGERDNRLVFIDPKF